MDEEKDFMTVSIPAALFKKIEDKIKGTAFASVSSYVAHVLGEVISETERNERKDPFSKDDEEKVKERLRALGYVE